MAGLGTTTLAAHRTVSSWLGSGARCRAIKRLIGTMERAWIDGCGCVIGVLRSAPGRSPQQCMRLLRCEFHLFRIVAERTQAGLAGAQGSGAAFQAGARGCWGEAGMLNGGCALVRGGLGGIPSA